MLDRDQSPAARLRRVSHFDALEDLLLDEQRVLLPGAPTLTKVEFLGTEWRAASPVQYCAPASMSPEWDRYVVDPASRPIVPAFEATMLLTHEGTEVNLRPAFSALLIHPTAGVTGCITLCTPAPETRFTFWQTTVTLFADDWPILAIWHKLGGESGAA